MKKTEKFSYKLFLRNLLISLILFFTLFMIIFGIRWIYKYFGSVNLDEILITMDLGLAGADQAMYQRFMSKVMSRVLRLGIPVSIIYALIWSIKTKHIARKIMLYLVPGIVLVAMALEFSKVDTGSLFTKTTNFYEQEYISAKDVKIEFKKPRNILVIALESIEKAYADPIAFETPGGLIPNISKYEADNVSFSDYQTYPGMTQTLGAITGIITGLPLLFSSNRSTNRFIGVPGLGDVFANNNYRTYAFFPAGNNYSNKNGMMMSKGFQHIFDGSYYLNQLPARPAITPFQGVEDGILFEMSRPQIQEIVANKKQPYFIFMETINTHIDGYPTKDCFNNSEDLGDIIKCSDKITGDFIKWFQKIDPTAIVVLVNDHNTMHRPMLRRLNKHEHIRETGMSVAKKVSRPMSNVFINSDAFNGAATDRKMTAVDFYPTIIEAAGGIIHGCRLGLGTSVSARCADTPTLREKYGDEKLPKLFQSKNNLYNKLLKGEAK